VLRLLGIVLVLAVLLTAGRLLTHKLIEPNLGLVVANLVGIVMAALFVWLVLHRLAGARPAELGYTTRGLAGAIVLGLLGAAAVTGILLGILAVWWSPEVAAEQWRELVSIGLADRLPYVLVGLTATIAEEPLFRGYLQPRLIDRVGLIGGLVATAVVFTMVHPRTYSGRFDLVLGLFLIGLVYGVLRGRDRSLVGPAVAHIMTWVIWAGN
jgi:membrane protease YdiL (CAAX protease family)